MATSIFHGFPCFLPPPPPPHPLLLRGVKVSPFFFLFFFPGRYILGSSRCEDGAVPGRAAGVQACEEFPEKFVATCDL